jgi:riboflavin biosynthesis pyrimidine reductase
VTTTDFEVDRLWPEPASGLSLDRAYLELDFPDPPPDRPWVGLNMVSSVDGRAEGAGVFDHLGTRPDRRLMRLLRTNYDAVLCGVGTLRATDLWTTVPTDLAAEREAAGRSAQPLAVLVAGTGEIPTDRRWFTTDQPRLILTGAGGMTAVPGAEVVSAPTPWPEPAWILATLAGRGIGRALLEGGPTLNASFHDAALIDELYWSVGPVMLGGDAQTMVAPGPLSPRAAELISVHRSGGELYLRYRFIAAATE